MRVAGGMRGSTLAMLAMLAALSSFTAVRAAEPTPAGAPMDAALLEKRLHFVETAPAELAAAGEQLMTGFRELLAKKSVTPADVKKICEISNRKTLDTFEALHKLVAMLSKPDVQATMSPEQRDRLDKARPASEQPAPQMDCASLEAR